MRLRALVLLLFCSCLNRQVSPQNPSSNVAQPPVITAIGGDGSATDRIVSALHISGTALDTVTSAALLASDGVTLLTTLTIGRAEATELELAVPQGSTALDSAAGSTVVLQLTAPAGVARQSVQILRGEKGTTGDPGPSYGSSRVLGTQFCSGNATNNCIINTVTPLITTLGTLTFTAPAAGNYVIALRGFCAGNEQDTPFTISIREVSESGLGFNIDVRTFNGVIPRVENAATGTSVPVFAELTLNDVVQGATVAEKIDALLDTGATGTAVVRCRLWPTVSYFANRFPLTVGN